ncbi:MAG: PIN domain nuclease [Deltaproteobacteria bacterium]|nr:PIN domain nuclease [Deltaproteobacteria bacterium]
MIVVDSSVWAAHFNGDARAQVARLDQALRAGEALAILPIILTEVLQGFRTEAGFRSAEVLMRQLSMLEPTVEQHVEAARLFRQLRQKGVTVRGAIDCVIAAVCIATGARLLTLDQDFRLIARHTSLQLEA